MSIGKTTSCEIANFLRERLDTHLAGVGKRFSKYRFGPVQTLVSAVL